MKSILDFFIVSYQDPCNLWSMVEPRLNKRYNLTLDSSNITLPNLFGSSADEKDRNKHAGKGSSSGKGNELEGLFNPKKGKFKIWVRYVDCGVAGKVEKGNLAEYPFLFMLIIPPIKGEKHYEDEKTRVFDFIDDRLGNKIGEEFLVVALVDGKASSGYGKRLKRKLNGKGYTNRVVVVTVGDNENPIIINTTLPEECLLDEKKQESKVVNLGDSKRLSQDEMNQGEEMEESASEEEIAHQASTSSNKVEKIVYEKSGKQGSGLKTSSKNYENEEENTRLNLAVCNFLNIGINKRYIYIIVHINMYYNKICNWGVIFGGRGNLGLKRTVEKKEVVMESPLEAFVKSSMPPSLKEVGVNKIMRKENIERIEEDQKSRYLALYLKLFGLYESLGGIYYKLRMVKSVVVLYEMILHGNKFGGILRYFKGMKVNQEYFGRYGIVTDPTLKVKQVVFYKRVRNEKGVEENHGKEILNDNINYFNFRKYILAKQLMYMGNMFAEDNKGGEDRPTMLLFTTLVVFNFIKDMYYMVFEGDYSEEAREEKTKWLLLLILELGRYLESQIPQYGDEDDRVESEYEIKDRHSESEKRRSQAHSRESGRKKTRKSAKSILKILFTNPKPEEVEYDRTEVSSKLVEKAIEKEDNKGIWFLINNVYNVKGFGGIDEERTEIPEFFQSIVGSSSGKQVDSGKRQQGINKGICRFVAFVYLVLFKLFMNIYNRAEKVGAREEDDFRGYVNKLYNDSILLCYMNAKEEEESVKKEVVARIDGELGRILGFKKCLTEMCLKYFEVAGLGSFRNVFQLFYGNVSSREMGMIQNKQMLGMERDEEEDETVRLEDGIKVDGVVDGPELTKEVVQTDNNQAGVNGGIRTVAAKAVAAPDWDSTQEGRYSCMIYNCNEYDHLYNNNRFITQMKSGKIGTEKKLNMYYNCNNYYHIVVVKRAKSEGKMWMKLYINEQELEDESFRIECTEVHFINIDNKMIYKTCGEGDKHIGLKNGGEDEERGGCRIELPEFNTKLVVCVGVKLVREQVEPHIMAMGDEGEVVQRETSVGVKRLNVLVGGEVEEVFGFDLVLNKIFDIKLKQENETFKVYLKVVYPEIVKIKKIYVNNKLIANNNTLLDYNSVYKIIYSTKSFELEEGRNLDGISTTDESISIQHQFVDMDRFRIKEGIEQYLPESLRNQLLMNIYYELYKKQKQTLKPITVKDAPYIVWYAGTSENVPARGLEDEVGVEENKSEDEMEEEELAGQKKQAVPKDEVRYKINVPYYGFLNTKLNMSVNLTSGRSTNFSYYITNDENWFVEGLIVNRNVHLRKNKSFNLFIKLVPLRVGSLRLPNIRFENISVHLPIQTITIFPESYLI